MADHYIHFRKQRDLGDLITDTFKFLRENYKLLFKLIFRIAGPALLLLAILLGYYSFMMGESMLNPLSIDFDNYNRWFFLTLMLLIISMVVFFALLYSVVLLYIRSYVDHKGKVDELEVTQGVKDNFMSMSGLFFVTGTLLVFGLVLVFPGIYLWVPFTIAPAVMILDKRSIGGTLQEIFRLISNNWWMTFFSLILIFLLTQIISMVFQMPLFIYYFIKALSMSQEGSMADPSSLFDWVYVLFNVLSSLIQYLLSVIIIVASSFIYYNLHEKRYATGSMEKIENLGSSERE